MRHRRHLRPVCTSTSRPKKGRVYKYFAVSQRDPRLRALESNVWRSPVGRTNYGERVEPLRRHGSINKFRARWKGARVHDSSHTVSSIANCSSTIVASFDIERKRSLSPLLFTRFLGKFPVERAKVEPFRCTFAFSLS